MIGLYMLQEEKEERKEDNQYHEYYHTYTHLAKFQKMIMIYQLILQSMDLLQLLQISKKSYVKKKKEKVETALKYVYKSLQIDEPNGFHL